MWKCYECKKVNWDHVFQCYNCKSNRKGLRECGIKLGATPELIKFIDMLEEREKQVEQIRKTAEIKIKKAEEIESRHSSLINESKSIENHIKKLSADHDPLKTTINELKNKKRQIELDLKKDICNLNKEKTVLTANVKELEKSVIHLENKIKIFTENYRKIVLRNVKGIIALLLLIFSTSIVAYLVYYTIQKSSKIEISISYDLGEILGAIFAGSGVAVAGLAYAKSVLEKDNKESTLGEK